MSPNGLPIIYVGRPSKWGNPFKIGAPYLDINGNKTNITPQDAVEFFKHGIEDEFIGFTKDQIKKELAGKNLSCWCKEGQPCHADILIELANV